MISLIATVLNEADNIRALLNTLEAQTRPPDEIIIVDGGSIDGTQEILQTYADSGKLALKLVVAEGCNISEGRNIAIAHATYDIIAITDAGVRLELDWLERITAPFDDDNVPVSAGFFKADPHTVFEVAMGATVLPIVAEIDPDTFLPSSRSVAVRKDAIERAGNYPEWLDYCEDLIFDLRLKATVAPFAFAPDAIAHFRPRSSLRAFYKQYYLYARGDGKANLWRKRHIIRYVTYFVVVPIVALLGILVHPLLWLLYLAGGAVYMRQPFMRLSEVMATYGKNNAVSPLDWLYAIALIPIIRVWGDVAKMIGYPVGLRWRAENNPPDWEI